MVDQVKGTDPGPGKTFNYKASDAADAKDCHTAAGQLFKGVFAHQHTGAAELSVHYLRPSFMLPER
jgi:hypothetical protein